MEPDFEWPDIDDDDTYDPDSPEQRGYDDAKAISDGEEE